MKLTAHYIAVSNGGVIESTKGMGLAADVFDEDKLAKLKGENAIAHALYSASKSSNKNNSFL